jgi:hypothetical protein
MTASSRGRVRALAALILAALASYAVVHAILGSGHTAVRYNGLTASQIVSTTDKARGKSFARIPANLVEHPLGAGLGVAGPASGVSGGPALTGVADAENEISFATLETGIPGLVVLVGFTGLLLGIGLRRCRLEPDPEARALLAAVIAPLAGMCALYLVSAVTPTTPGGPYLWAAGGIVAYWLVLRPAALRQDAASRAAL